MTVIRFACPRLTLAATLAVSLAACAPSVTSVNPDPSGNSTDKTGEQETGSKVKTTHDASTNVYSTRVDATSESTYVYFDLDTQKEVTPADPATDKTWDMAFMTTTILSNSGVSGSGNAKVARLADTSFESLKQAPGGGYLVDAADSDDTGTAPDSAFLVGGNWYSYDMATHLISPKKDVVYVVESTAGKFYKIAFTGYYDTAGTSRFPQFKWAEIPSPYQSLSFTGGANPGTDSWTYLNLRTGAVVTPADPATSTDWDLAMRAYHVMTNSAVSGGGSGGALATAATSLLTLAEAPSGGTYTADSSMSVRGTSMPGNAALTTWYDYNPTTHAVTSKNTVYALRLADGNLAKLQFTDYVDGKYGVKWILFPGK